MTEKPECQACGSAEDGEESDAGFYCNRCLAEAEVEMYDNLFEAIVSRFDD